MGKPFSLTREESQHGGKRLLALWNGCGSLLVLGLYLKPIWGRAGGAVGLNMMGIMVLVHLPPRDDCGPFPTKPDRKI